MTAGFICIFTWVEFQFPPRAQFPFNNGTMLKKKNGGKTVDTRIYNLMVFTFAHVLFNWGINNLQPFNLNCKSNAMNNILIMLRQHCRRVSICACTFMRVWFWLPKFSAAESSCFTHLIKGCILYRWTVTLMLRSAIRAQKNISYKNTLWALF